MNDLGHLLRSAERLREQARQMREEIDALHEAMLRLSRGSDGPPGTMAQAGCLEVAAALARDLGPEFSSEDPDGLGGRGDAWFADGSRG